MILSILLYVFAAIGVLCTGLVALVLIGYAWATYVAKANLERLARRAAVDAARKDK